MRKLKFVGLFFLIIAFLSVTPLFPQVLDSIPATSSDETRILKLLVVADQGYRKQIPSWRGEIISFIAIVSKALDSQTKIQLQITKFENWERKSLKDVSYYLVEKELAKTFPRINEADFDVVIVLTSHHLELPAWCWDKDGYILITTKKETVAFDQYEDVKRRTYPLLSYSERKVRFPVIILHEIGHIFGCEHETDERFVMAIRGLSMIFSKESIETIKKNKWRKFPLVPGKSDKGE